MGRFGSSRSSGVASRRRPPTNQPPPHRHHPIAEAEAVVVFCSGVFGGLGRGQVEEKTTTVAFLLPPVPTDSDGRFGSFSFVRPPFFIVQFISPPSWSAARFFRCVILLRRCWASRSPTADGLCCGMIDDWWRRRSDAMLNECIECCAVL